MPRECVATVTMARNRASAKTAGTRWATAIAEWCKEQGYSYAERRATTGAKDKGDIAGLPVVIEAKDHARVTLAAFVKEANVEAVNAGVEVGVAWVKRVGKTSPADGYVVMDGAAFLRLLAVVRSAEGTGRP